MLKVDSVTKQFRARNGEPVVALQDVEIDVRRGEFVMVVGPSGSGKSTLLFTVGGMQRPDAGNVLFGDTNLYRLSATQRSRLRRTSMGFVFQTFNLIPYLSCLENVALPAVLEGEPRSSSRKRAKGLLERLNLGHRLEHRPSELSVGERQRVALCRSLVNKPEMILADEPTGNLDGHLTEEVIQILSELNSGGQTIIMVTHDLTLAERGTRVIGLHEGSVVDNRPSRNGAAAV